VVFLKLTEAVVAFGISFADLRFMPVAGVELSLDVQMLTGMAGLDNNLFHRLGLLVQQYIYHIFANARNSFPSVCVTLCSLKLKIHHPS